MQEFWIYCQRQRSPKCLENINKALVRIIHSASSTIHLLQALWEQRRREESGKNILLLFWQSSICELFHQLLGFCFLSDETRTPHSSQTSSALDWGTVDSCRLVLIYPTCTLGMFLCPPPMSPTPSSAPRLLPAAIRVSVCSVSFSAK